MILIPGICPSCRAVLSVAKEREAMICPYCKSPFVSEAAVQKFNDTYTFKSNVGIQNIYPNNQADFEIIAGVLKKYKGQSTYVVIPDTVKEIGQEEQRWEACFENTGVETVIINSNVKVINKRAFRRCRYLKDIKFHEGLISIGEYAFEDCINLEVLNIPKSVKKIGAYAFKGCKNIEALSISEILLKSNNISYPEDYDEYDIRGMSVGEIDKIYGESYAINFPKLREVYVDGVRLNEHDGLWKHLPNTVIGYGLYMEELKRKTIERRKENNRCIYCNGTFSSFLKICLNCGRTKDY